MFYFKLHKKEKILAVCDEELINTELNDHFKISDFFYGNDKCNEDDIIDKYNESESLNAVGNKIVNFLIDNGIVDHDKVMKINNVMHAIVIKV